MSIESLMAHRLQARASGRLYNEKEFIEMHGYDTYDFEWRHYYPAIARFVTIDPLAEVRPWESPYAFLGNNFVNRIDPDGLMWYSFQEEYEDDDGNMQTRTQYKYVRGGMSEKDREAGGYTELGLTHWGDGTYFSLGGGQFSLEGRGFLTAVEVARADNMVIGAISAWNVAGTFWENYGYLFSLGGEAANALSLFMNLPVPIAGLTNTLTYIDLAFNAPSLLSGQASARQYANAAMAIVALYGGKPGVIAALSYTAGMTTYDAGVALHEIVQRTGQDIRTLNRNTEQRLRSGRSPFFNLPMGF